MRGTALFLPSLNKPMRPASAGILAACLRRKPAAASRFALPLHAVLLALILVLALPTLPSHHSQDGTADSQATSLVCTRLDDSPTYRTAPSGCLLPTCLSFLFKKGPEPDETAGLPSRLFWIWILYVQETQHKILLI